MTRDFSDVYVLRAEGLLPSGQLAAVLEAVTGDSLRAPGGDAWAFVAESFALSRFRYTFGVEPTSVCWLVPGGDA